MQLLKLLLLLRKPFIQTSHQINGNIELKQDSYEDYLVYYLGRSLDGVMHTEDDYLVIYFENSTVVKHKILTDTFNF